MRKACLIYAPDTSEEESFEFVDRIVVGRRRGRDANEPRVQLDDKAISGRHCVVTQTSNGVFLVRDVSRNGTKVDGRRLVPNVDMQVESGTVIRVGEHRLMLWVDTTGDIDVDPRDLDDEQTVIVRLENDVTIVVGDIKGYTSLNERFNSTLIWQAVEPVFQALSTIVESNGGTIKEYQGDAIVAFWENDDERPGRHAIQACRASLLLHQEALRLSDPSRWPIAEHPLQMDWALTTGRVAINSIGVQRSGLALVGDAINVAFRLEKLVSEETGPIIVDQATQSLAAGAFDFNTLGSFAIQGRSQSEEIFALTGRRS